MSFLSKKLTPLVTQEIIILETALPIILFESYLLNRLLVAQAKNPAKGYRRKNTAFHYRSIHSLRYGDLFP